MKSTVYLRLIVPLDAAPVFNRRIAEKHRVERRRRSESEYLHQKFRYLALNQFEKTAPAGAETVRPREQFEHGARDHDILVRGRDPRRRLIR